MPVRLEPFINNRIYHVFNKTIDKRNIFEDDSHCEQLLKIMRYYRSSKAKISLSKLKIINEEIRSKILEQVSYAKYYRVKILAYDLMPNHFHLLIKQINSLGIQKFMADSINSFTRHFNILTERKGPLFLTRFKAVMIRTDEQLKHVSRYIHLQRYSGGLIKNITRLINIKWSSYQAYLGNQDDLIDTDEIMSLFDFDKYRYRQFVESNADYQKTLETVKHATK